MMIAVILLLAAAPETTREIGPSDVYTLLQSIYMGAGVLAVAIVGVWVYFQRRRERIEEGHYRDMQQWTVALNSAVSCSAEARDAARDYAIIAKEFTHEMREALNRSAAGHEGIGETLQRMESTISDTVTELAALRQDIQGLRDREQNA